MASKIVIVGVAFAPSDFELRWLLRQGAALRTSPVELHVVNPCEKDRGAALDLFERDCVVREFEAVEEYLAWTKEEPHE
jgi:hypothetical protein